LIVGAGPTGLVLALGLARRNVPFRLIDAASVSGEHSRAMVVQARTLELYGQYGFADEMMARGIKVEAVHVREGGTDGQRHEVTTVRFGDLGGDISPYPFALCFPQDDHQRLLIEQLQAAGGTVEWGTRLTGFTQDADGVRATIAREDGQAEEVAASYVAGCDGAHSAVRETLGVGFPGGTYDQLFYVADVQIEGGFQRDIFVNLGEHILALMLPVRSSGMQRLIGLVPPELSHGADLTFEDIRSQVEALVGIQVTRVNWFSSYRVHHRVAEHFRIGRAFLLGDAGHIHSPAGGQGMNTGIGDAMNLGWKLAQVLQGRAAPPLLDSYEPERIGFARRLVATTDRVFTPLASEGFVGEVVRRFVMPLVVTVATRFDISRHQFFRTLSQTDVHFADSPLSVGEAGHVHGGDRLPWTGGQTEDNFGPLRSLDWQVHVYGELSSDLRQTCERVGLAWHRFAWSDGAEKAGLKRNAAYLVRPDGYVALALPEQSANDLQLYVGRLGLRFERTASVG
jgi:2-polyprenyl-6-methoxyphenol hydroxylase-like FAD-dependent oxidoreductase